MPIYTYKCKNCGKVFEKFKKMSSNGNESCDECSSEAVRVFSPAGIIFKGSGFYTTDYKSGSNRSNLNKSGVRDEKKETKKDEVKAESGSEKAADSTKASGMDDKPKS